MITMNSTNWQEGGGVLKPVNNSNSVQTVQNLYVNGNISATGFINTQNNITCSGLSCSTVTASGNASCSGLTCSTVTASSNMSCFSLSCTNIYPGYYSSAGAAQLSGPLSVYNVSGDPNRGLHLFQNDQDGASYTNYQGGLESWYGIGFRCRMDGTTRIMFDTRDGNISVTGSINGTSKNFDIPHPIQNISNKRLVHASIEGPRYDLIYRGKTKLINGSIDINLDKDSVTSPECAMSNGTFESLVSNPTFYLQNPNSFDRLIGKINGNILSVTCENKNSNDEIHWLVIGERKDNTIKNSKHANQNGYLITEYIENIE